MLRYPILLIFLLSKYGYPAAVAADADSLVSDTVITLERTECYGTCPAYSLTIYSDGLVTYNGQDYVRVEGRDSSRIAPDSVIRLVDQFEEISYFELKDSYYEDEDGVTATDMPTTTTSLRRAGREKQVVNYYGAPNKLVALEDLIDDVCNSYQWVHNPVASDCACITLARFSKDNPNQNYTVSISGSGGVFYSGGSQSPFSGHRAGQVYPRRADQIFYYSLSILKPRPAYYADYVVYGDSLSESFSVVTLALKNKACTIRNGGSAPEMLDFVENLIDSTVTTTKWVYVK